MRSGDATRADPISWHPELPRGARLDHRRTPLLIRALRYLPRAALSRLAGWVACRHWPAPLQRALNLGFGRAVGVDFAELRSPLAEFRTLQEFFTRELREGARPLDPAPDALLSPCDGRWGAAGSIRGGQLLQVKGRSYSLAELLGSEADARALEGGEFATLYLAPRDYHRFHTPCAARVSRARYLPGALWPVNRAGLHGVDALFARNERLCAFLARDGRELCVVAVGAMLVGRVRLSFDELCTRTRPAARCERSYTDVRLAAGAELGRFEFGSTLVLLIPPDAGRLALRPPGEPVRVGARIGTLGGAV
jgi:phosphatidylserine decarboxylase